MAFMALMAQRHWENATNATNAKCQLKYFSQNVVSIQKSCIFEASNNGNDDTFYQIKHKNISRGQKHNLVFRDLSME